MLSLVRSLVVDDVNQLRRIHRAAHGITEEIDCPDPVANIVLYQFTD